MNSKVPWIISWAIFTILSPSALAQPAQSSTPTLDPLTEKVLIAIVSAVLSLLTGYILFQLKERREAKKQLSYDLEIRHGLLGVEENIARYVSLTYKGHSADQITYVRCDVKNTGNTVVKEQYLRFDFGEGTQVLDSYTDPIPPKEIGVAETLDFALQPHEKRFKIQHLEKQQYVGFRFVLSATAEREVKIVPFNEEGDVEVIAGSISRAADDRRLAEQFIFFYVLTLILPPIFSQLPSFIRDFAVGLVYVLLAVAMVPLLRPFSRIVAAAIAALNRPTQPSLSIAHLHQEPAAELNIVTGGAASFHNKSEVEAQETSTSSVPSGSATSSPE